jgi:hypothetical protein
MGHLSILSAPQNVIVIVCSSLSFMLEATNPEIMIMKLMPSKAMLTLAAGAESRAHWW